MKPRFLKSQEEKTTHWPRLHRALQAGALSYIDFALAEKLLCREQNQKILEESAAFICHLSQSTRKGHLCVKVEDRQVTPSPFDGETTEAPELTELNVAQGAAMLPSSLVTEVDTLDGSLPSTPICRCGHRYYFQKYWLNESLFLKNFDRVCSAAPTLPISVEKNQMEGLNAKQMLAIQRFSEKSLTLICGGPGTGKTYTAGRLIKIFWDSLKDSDQRKHCEIALAAPTGKAAANLQKSLQNAIGSLKEFPLIQAKTLHALLGTHRSKKEKLSADLILIDESSMIDIRLMAQFMASVKTGARIVLIGDPFQLPPVEVGSVFADIVNSQTLSQHLVELTTCVRTEQQDLITFAKAVQKGDEGKIFRLLTSSADIKFLHEEKDVFHHALSSFPSPKFLHQDPKEILEQYDHFRLLSSLRKGPFGVDAMNQRLLQRMKMRVKQDEWFMAPIMIASNNYRMELFNGEVGVLVSPPSSEQTANGDYALFSNNSNGEVRKIPACLLPKYEYAYCLSVHKSQGSEFDRVLLLMPEGTEFFGREGLYTAVTRARKKLEIWGSHSTIAKTLKQHSFRQSGISDHIIVRRGCVAKNRNEDRVD